MSIKKGLVAFLSAASLASCSVVPTAPTKPAHEPASRPHYLDSLPSAEKLKSMTPEDRFAEEMLQLVIGANTEPFTNVVITNTSPKVKYTLEGKELSLELPLYRDLGDKLQYVIDGSMHPKSVIMADLKKALKESVDEAHLMFKKMPSAVNSRKDKIFGVKAKHLKDSKIPGTPLAFGDVYNYMAMEKRDFVPDKYYFAPLEFGIAGATLPEKGEILYVPLGRTLDELAGKKVVLVHELIHKNSKLQDVLWGFTSNPELYAYLAELELSPKEIGTVSLHPYGAPLRELARDYMNVDIRKMLIDSIDTGFIMYLEMNPAKLKSVGKKGELLANAFKDILMEDAYPEELALPHWWMAAQEYTKNPNLAFEVAAAKKFVPALLKEEKVKKLFTFKKKELEKVIADTMSAYKPPKMGSFGPFILMSGPNLKMLFVSNAMKAGFSMKDAKLAYHYFLYTQLLNEDGTVNYSWLPLSPARNALQELHSDFVTAVVSIKDKKDFQMEDLKRDANVLGWVVKRLSTAENYKGIATLTGAFVPGKFDARLLDPSWDIDDIYPGLLPKHAANPEKAALRSEMLVPVKEGLEVLIRRYDVFPDLGLETGEDVITATVRVDDKLAPHPSIVYYVSGTTDEEDLFIEGVMVVDSDNTHKLGYGDFDYAKILRKTEVKEIDSAIMEALKDLDVKKEEIKKDTKKKVSAKVELPKDGIAELADTDLDGLEDSLQMISAESGEFVISYYKILGPAAHSDFKSTLLLDGDSVVKLSKKGFEKLTFEDIKKRNPFMVQVLSGKEVKTYVDENLDGTFDWEL